VPRHSHLPGRRGLGLRDTIAPERPAVAAGNLHCVLRRFARRRDLGVHRRSVPNIRPVQGQGVGSASHWLMNTLIQLEFPVIVNYMSAATPFVFFSVMTVIQFLTVLFVYPETMGQSLEAFQRRLVGSDSKTSQGAAAS